MSEVLRIHVEPQLENPALLLAFEGFNDAGEAASSALRFVSDAIHSVPLAELDPESFYDFTVCRPKVVLDAARNRRIVWPSNEFRFGSLDGQRELVTGLGVEPHLEWRTFCDHYAELARNLGVKRVVLLGAYLADVIYSQPVKLTGFATHAAELEKLGVEQSSYEGPTGIVGVLAERFALDGMSVISLWAGLPHYINASPNPRGALALLQALTAYLDFRVDDAPLRQSAAEFEQKISHLVSADPELAEYVKQLKRREFAQ